ncbi:MAG: hypothetical protein JO360_00770 [Acidobacteria bacterium]|nr:hypothetical protein [Acidobacteriota bacterium]
MPIPIIIVYGSRTNFDPLGWTARECPRCRKVQPFQGYDKVQSKHVYYIHGKEKSIGLILICDFCETTYGLRPNSSEAQETRFTRMWRREEGLGALVEKTNPRLGQVAHFEQPTRQELFALLESVNERSSPYKTDAGKGFGRGAGIGAVTLPVLLLLLYVVGLGFGLDALGTGMFGVFVGGIVGGIVGAVKYKFSRSKELAQEILVSAMTRHALTLNILERALKHYPGKLKYVSSGLAELASGA